MRFVLPLLFLLLMSASAEAIGPRSVTSSGLPVKWLSMPIDVDLESDLDLAGKDLSLLVEDALNTWKDLSDSDVTFQVNDLGVAVDANDNDQDGFPDYCNFISGLGPCPTSNSISANGTNPLVIDEDAEITKDIFGLGNEFTTLGFAAIFTSNSITGGAIQGLAVFNASCLQGYELPGCTTESGQLSFSDNDFTSFIVHELGHFLGLDHSQVNLTEAENDLNGDDQLITTMYPTFIVGNGASFKVPKRDDQVGLAQLYPSSSFTAGTWKITGKVYEEGGVQEFQCANLVARNVNNPKVDAISAISGDFSLANSEDGSFEILGLIPGESYSLVVEPLDPQALGSSGYTPCRGVSSEPAPPQFTTVTASRNFTGEAGDEVTLLCTLGTEGDCVVGSPATGSSGPAGGCELMRN